MVIKEPREFWIHSIIDMATSRERYVVTPDQPQFTAYNYIHVREVIPGDINDHIIDLIHQRSIAFDEALKYRLLSEELMQVVTLGVTIRNDHIMDFNSWKTMGKNIMAKFLKETEKK